MSSVKSQLQSVGSQLEVQSLNALVAGFSFASAIAWMDVARYIIGTVVKVGKNGGAYYALSALLTTLLGIVVFMVVSRISKDVRRPESVAYAVTG
jgi:hypothetical protein